MGRAQGKPWEANSFGVPCLWHMPIRGVVYAATINSSSICRNCVFYPLQMQQRNCLTENLLEDRAITAESCSACTACSARRFQRVHHLNNRKSMEIRRRVGFVPVWIALRLNYWLLLLPAASHTALERCGATQPCQLVANNSHHGYDVL